MHSGGKGGGGQKEKQMYNNETAKNITKIQLTYLHIYYLQHFSPKISLSRKRKSILN